MINISFLFFPLLLSLLAQTYSKERGLYINQFRNILGDVNAEDKLISFLLRNSFNYICLYDVGQIIDQGRSNELGDFVYKVRSNGIHQIGAVGGWTGHFDNFGLYQKKFSSEPLKQLDVFNLESEYWNDANVTLAFTKWITLVNYMKKKALNKLTEAYLGQRNPSFTTSQFTTIQSTGIDRFLLSCYSSNSEIEKIMNNCKNVYDKLNSTAIPQKIYPLFSTVPEFLGGNFNITQVEENFTIAFDNRYGDRTSMTIGGYMFFAYGYFFN